MGLFTSIRDFAEGGLVGFPAPGQRQAAQKILRDPRIALPQNVLNKDSATPLDTLALGPLARYRALRNTGRIAGLAAGAYFGGEAALGGGSSSSAAGAETGAGEDFGLTGFEGGAAPASSLAPAAALGASTGAGEDFGLTGAEGAPAAAPVTATGLETGAGESFGLTGNEGAIDPAAFDSLTTPLSSQVDTSSGLSTAGGNTGAGEDFGLTGNEGPAASDISPAEGTTEQDLMQNLRDQEIKSLGGKGALPTAAKTSFMSNLLKYGPLALGGLNQAVSYAQSQKYAKQIAGIGGPQRAVGQQLIGQYQRGELSPSDSYNISQWENSAIAQSRQYFANAGQSDSAAAMESERAIHAQAASMKDQSLRALLTIGTNLLNQTDVYQQASINAELNADNQARNSLISFMSAYGSWMRALPQITG